MSTRDAAPDAPDLDWDDDELETKLFEEPSPSPSPSPSTINGQSVSDFVSSILDSPRPTSVPLPEEAATPEPKPKSATPLTELVWDDDDLETKLFDETATPQSAPQSVPSEPEAALQRAAPDSHYLKALDRLRAAFSTLFQRLRPVVSQPTPSESEAATPAHDLDWNDDELETKLFDVAAVPQPVPSEPEADTPQSALALRGRAYGYRFDLLNKTYALLGNFLSELRRSIASRLGSREG